MTKLHLIQNKDRRANYETLLLVQGGSIVKRQGIKKNPWNLINVREFNRHKHRRVNALEKLMPETSHESWLECLKENKVWPINS